MVLETKRLLLREMNPDDYQALFLVFGDPETMWHYRNRGIAGKLLNMVVADMRGKGITPLYLVSDHIGFYERYGWEFLCMVQGDDEPDMTRMYIHQ